MLKEDIKNAIDRISVFIICGFMVIISETKMQTISLLK
tara:strand:- start:2526 stop:2639 length:114 start_codon:yes stop_codon:yes gene_type:complete